MKILIIPALFAIFWVAESISENWKKIIKLLQQEKDYARVSKAMDRKLLDITKR